MIVLTHPPHRLTPSPQGGEGWGGGYPMESRAYGATSSLAPPPNPSPLGRGDACGSAP